MSEQLDTALDLLARCLPHLDLAISEHNDGVRLQRDILMFLAGAGRPGYLEVREPDRPVPPPSDCLDPHSIFYRKVRQG